MTQTARWQELDRLHHLHPFTDHQALGRKGSRIITRAEGVYLWDSNDNRILDGMAGLWCVNLGYGRTELATAAFEQLKTLPYYNNFFQTTHPPAIELAALLARVTPAHLNRVFFTNSGSEAIDTAMRIVRRYWQVRGEATRTVIIARKNAYHGSTIAGASLGGMRPMHDQGGPWVPDIEHIEQPYWYRLGGNASPEAFGRTAAGWLAERIEQVGPERIAAFVGEPIQGAGGVIVPPDSYWPEIQRICQHYGILLVADEVICGFGRTGRWFGSESYAIQADLMTIAKGLSSGYLRIGGVMVSDDVAATLIEHGGEFQHGFTYSGHPVACAVACVNINLLDREGIITTAGEDTGPYFQERLRELSDHPLVGEVRGKGFVAAIQLCKDKASRQPFEPEANAGGLCRDHAFANGLVMRAVGDSMILSPPLIITREQIDELVVKARTALDLTEREL